MSHNLSALEPQGEPPATHHESGLGVVTPADTVVHSIDGIDEYDNRLPNWWLFTFYAAIAFAVVYWFHYQLFGGEGSIARYEREMQPIWAQEAARLRAAGQVTPQLLLALSRDQRVVAQGRSTFVNNCVSCHTSTGGGNIGPNLTDNAWIHGSNPTQIYRTVLLGVSNKGMPAWGTQLGADAVQGVVAYLLTIKNTNVAGGRAPQGTVEP